MSNLFTPEAIEAASAETERLCRELDITNADHIALWLESWLEDDCSVAFLACRIIEAHEAVVADIAASRDRASDACASVQRERDALREMLVHATDALRNLERANEEVCAARTVRTYHSYVSDGAEPLLLGLDNARERARAFLSRYEGEVK